MLTFYKINLILDYLHSKNDLIFKNSTVVKVLYDVQFQVFFTDNSFNWNSTFVQEQDWKFWLLNFLE